MSVVPKGQLQYIAHEPTFSPEPRNIDKLDTFKTVSGGDHNASQMYLVNLQKLFSTDVIKAFKEYDEKK